MMYLKLFLRVALTLCSFLPTLSFAQTAQSEDFTGATTNNDWYFFNGACLTAGSGTATTSPGPVPNCTTIRGTYYNQNLVGGHAGVAGTAETLPDPVGSGALRLTNGNQGSGLGYNQSGAIVSDFSFPTSQGIQITFKTVTYRGDSGGAGHNGADGISFYLMDALKPAGIGAWGGSLGYSCSNSNPPYDGLDGAYVAVGIDEYGNFLNGASLMPGYTGTNTASGDNTAWGYGYKPGRIGMRGAGNISWNALNTAYPTNPGSSTSPYYPASLATACPAGSVYNSTTAICEQSCTAASAAYSATNSATAGTPQCAACPVAGTTYSQPGNTCGACPASYTWNAAFNTCARCPSGTYDAATNQCINICAVGTTLVGTSCVSCANGILNTAGTQCQKSCPTPGGGFFYTYNAAVSTSKCQRCATGQTYVFTGPNANKCLNTNGSTTSPNNSTGTSTVAPISVAATSAAPATATVVTNTPTYSGVTGVTSASANQMRAAVQNTCRTGHLWNYSNPFAPTDAGAATLANSVNTAKILNYAPIPNAYSELSALPTPLTIANESAYKRSEGTPIFYNLKITQDGLLSLSFSVSGAAYQSVIKDQNIATANGDVPANVRFGIAGSTGGSNNIHEIMCFKAAPDIVSGSSTSVNQRLASKVEAGTQAYFAFYNQNNWTGALTANSLLNNAGTVTVDPVANWDASCVLNGTTAATGCTTTGVSGATTALAPSSRVMLTCRGSCNGAVGNRGIALAYGNLSLSQKAFLDAGDSLGATRVSYLRGDRTNEINTSGVGSFRTRDSVLGDIVDSSPTWVGQPLNLYTGTWSDHLPANPVGTPDTIVENSGTQSYAQFMAAQGTRLNVIYAGANDGFIHGFRSGAFDTNGNFVDNAANPNDGKEVLAYMPKAVLEKIHDNVSTADDFSSSRYGHHFYVDATPVADDLFYGGAWHTWLVGGLGEGGAAIFALDVTNPNNFTEANAANIVIGEWNSSTISCATPGGASCGQNLGNTYGTPQIRRLHNGKWGVIFGNGFTSANGDGGIYIMTVDPSDASKTFYYLTTNTATGGANGIAYVSPADLDGDHITDYIYAGDLLGNVWRFDVTSTDPTNWAAGATPLFTTATGQPITTKLQLVATTINSGGVPRLMIEFGTGKKTLLTNTTPDSYVGGAQSIYAIWDWNMEAWNTASSVDFSSLTSAATGLTSPFTMAKTNLQAQVFSASTTSVGQISGTDNTVCWKAQSLCSIAADNNKFGWYVDLAVSGGLSEQVVYNPIFFQGAFIVNSTTPANNVPTSCTVLRDVGITYVVSATTGGVFSGAFPQYADLTLSGVTTGATGSSAVVTTAQNTTTLVFQTNDGGTPGGGTKDPTLPVNLPKNTTTKRLTWVELR